MARMIYALVSSGEHPENLHSKLQGIQGIGGTELTNVSYESISAIISENEKADFTAEKEKVIEFAGVIEALSQGFTLLPMRFGSIMDSIEELNTMLERNYVKIRQNLDFVENKLEFGLKIFCDPEKITAELSSGIVAGIDHAESITSESGNSVFRDYVNKKLREHRIEELRLKYAETVIAEITEYFTGMNTMHTFRKMVSETNIIDALFLLDKDQKDTLVVAVAEMQKRNPLLSFMLTGPWPPYNFVDKSIK
jgi:hypothetical protein